ncbi:MAG: hypothetical protein KGL39_36100 [Patescibacteria group bacterium]|nr:hypothetical protein [Patescibacteria group bacterium]
MQIKSTSISNKSTDGGNHSTEGSDESIKHSGDQEEHFTHNVSRGQTAATVGKGIHEWTYDNVGKGGPPGIPGGNGSKNFKASDAAHEVMCKC